MALIDELRRLSVTIPPNFRALSGEVADLLGAAISYAEHGEAILDAAKDGPQAVADFFHQHIADNRPEDAAEPERGQPVENVAPTGTAPAAVGVSQADFSQLAGLVGQLAGAVNELVQERRGPAEPPAPDAPPAPAPPAASTEAGIS